MKESFLTRYNAFQDILLKELAKKFPRNKGWQLTGDKELPQSITQLRPDAAFINEKSRKIRLVEFTCPWDDGKSDLVAARRWKQNKYADLVRELSMKGWDTELAVLIVGARGSWDPVNDVELAKVGVHDGRKLESVKRTAVASVVDHSRKIYYSHMMGDRYMNLV